MIIMQQLKTVHPSYHVYVLKVYKVRYPNENVYSSKDHLFLLKMAVFYKSIVVVMLAAVFVQGSSASCACKYACRKIVTSMFFILIIIILFSGCQNGGRIVESGQLFKCHCKPGFTGNKCQTKIPPPCKR